MRLKTLNGAPLCEHLDFRADHLLDGEALASHLHEEPLEIHQTATAPELKWRRLAYACLRPEWPQPYLPTEAFRGSDPDASFSVPEIDGLSGLPADDTTTLDQTVETNDFVEHSLIFHDTLLSSQIAGKDAADNTFSSLSSMGTSFESAVIESQLCEARQGPVLDVPSTFVLTPLGSLPSAAHLRSLYPQTLTPNILCVLIARPADREVIVKKGGYRMMLREIHVADDTRSGFKISIWNRPSAKGEPQNTLTTTLDHVRVGNVLLIRNLALNAYRDDVYGQSLNPSITRVRTTVETLSSSRGMSSRELGALPPAVVTAFMRVKRWASVHVAPEKAGVAKRKGAVETWSRSTKRSRRSVDAHDDDDLPPDTMEAA